jgi:transcriptional regulator with XRE-family HTH domain
MSLYVERILTPGYIPFVDLKDWVKTERERRGWTQEDLAEAMSTDATTIERQEVIALEKGRNKGSTVRMRDALARAFGALPPELGGVPATPPDSSRPVFGNLPGYAAAERAARARPGAALYEEQDWAAPRGWSGVLSVHEVSPDFVITLVAAAREARLHPGRSAEDKKIDAQIKGLETKDNRRLAKKKAAEDPGAPLVLKPRSLPRKRRPK